MTVRAGNFRWTALSPSPGKAKLRELVVAQCHRTTVPLNLQGMQYSRPPETPEESSSEPTPFFMFWHVVSESWFF